MNFPRVMETDGKEVQGPFRTVPLTQSELDFSGVPYSVSVLKVGYCIPQPDGTFRADGTITLITGPKIILVDTGGPWDRDFLKATLKDRGLEPGDVHLVVCTHGHSDHVGNLSLFPTAVIVVGYDISEGDTYRPNRMAEGQAYTIDEHVSICHFTCVLSTQQTLGILDVAVSHCVEKGEPERTFRLANDDDDTYGLHWAFMILKDTFPSDSD